MKVVSMQFHHICTSKD